MELEASGNPGFSAHNNKVVFQGKSLAGTPPVTHGPGQLPGIMTNHRLRRKDPPTAWRLGIKRR